jgi:hypothetical protein
MERHPLAHDVLAPLLPGLDRDVMSALGESPPESDRGKSVPWIAERADEDPQCRRGGLDD